MQIRISRMKWIALGVGMILIAGSTVPIRAESWFTFKSNKGKKNVSDEQPGPEAPPPDVPDPDSGANAPSPDSTPRGPAASKSTAANIDCPPGQPMYASDGAQYYSTGKCRRCGSGMRNGYCARCCSRCACYRPVNPWYCDPRDLQVYAAQGYNVPVTVPLAPMVQTYNYGWGIPSSRLSAAGNYMSWQPMEAYSLSGRGRLPATYPVVNRPTDTTQLGYYYNYVPEWQPRW
jgi:hypothetical protein